MCWAQTEIGAVLVATVATAAAPEQAAKKKRSQAGNCSGRCLILNAHMESVAITSRIFAYSQACACLRVCVCVCESVRACVSAQRLYNEMCSWFSLFRSSAANRADRRQQTHDRLWTMFDVSSQILSDIVYLKTKQHFWESFEKFPSSLSVVPFLDCIIDSFTGFSHSTTVHFPSLALVICQQFISFAHFYSSI